MIKRLSILAAILIIATSANLYINQGSSRVETAEIDRQNSDNPETARAEATSAEVASGENEYSKLSPAAGTAQIGGDFSLINQDGKPVTNADFKGKVMLVFFGFTSCPDICPTTTATIAKTLKNLGDKAAGVAPLFISIDPETDTPKTLKSYLANFDQRIIGLTGSEKQVKQATSAYKAFASKNGETIDHSGFIYIMDKNGAYAQHFAYDAKAEDISAAISQLLK